MRTRRDSASPPRSTTAIGHGAPSTRPASEPRPDVTRMTSCRLSPARILSAGVTDRHEAKLQRPGRFPQHHPEVDDDLRAALLSHTFRQLSTFDSVATFVHERIIWRR